MELTIYIREALANLLSSKLRSLLAVLGVLVGTASVVALVSGGQIATENALAQFKALGTDLLSVSISPKDMSSTGSESSLSLTQANSLKATTPGVDNLAPYTSTFAPTTFLGKEIDSTIIGGTESLQDLAKIQIAQGRFVSQLDKSAYYCFIGRKISNNIKQAGIANPIGQQIRLGNNIFTIIGVAKPWAENAFIFANINESIIIPLETSYLFGKTVKIRNIIFRLKEGASIDKVKTSLTAQINQLIGEQQLYFRSAEELIESMRKQHDTFTWLLGFIGGISLLVGGIGVMNIMLVSVSERRREIGVRMAVGAKQKDIQLMFLIEAVVLTLFGGFIGVLFGIGVSYIISIFANWQFKLFLLPPLVGSAVSVFVGLFFGFYPAYQASKLDPIQTLRAE